MTLSEFKGWFEGYRVGCVRDSTGTTRELVDALFCITEKLASAEEYKLQCQLCKSTEPCRCHFPQLAPQCPKCELVYVPIYGVETKCGNCINKAFDAEAKKDFDAQSQTELCHYCKNPLVLIMPPEAGVNPQVPLTGVCSVCHLYQP